MEKIATGTPARDYKVACRLKLALFYNSKKMGRFVFAPQEKVGRLKDLGKVEFKTWMNQDIKGRCFVLELVVGGKYFEDHCWPQIVEKLGGGKVVRIKGKRSGKKKEGRFYLLFSGRRRFCCWGFGRKPRSENKKYQLSPFSGIYLFRLEGRKGVE